MEGGTETPTDSRLSPGLVWVAALIIGAIAFLAAFVLHYAPGRDYALSQDPIIFIGISHAALFIATAGVVRRFGPGWAWLLVVWTTTGPWAAILVQRDDPFHQAYLILTLAPIVMASLLVSYRGVILVGMANAVGIFLLRRVEHDASGLHITAMLMVLVFMLLLAAARFLWDMDRHKLALQHEALQRSMAQAMEVEKMREIDDLRRRFLNTASHELNTPLTPLLMQTSILARRFERDGPPEALSGIFMIQRNAKRLAALVTDILDVARIEASELRLARETVDLSTLVQNEVDNVAPVAEATGTTLTATVAPDVQVDGDPLRIGQVLANLLNNANKFTAQGDTIRVELTTENGDAVIRIRDDGVGMDPRMLPRLFRPFSQVHEPDAEIGGTGLGLYICRGIVGAHGGEIEATSDGLDQGSCFTIRLPRL